MNKYETVLFLYINYRKQEIHQRCVYALHSKLFTCSLYMCVGLYCSGWVKTGPIGVILNNITKSYETADAIHEDFVNGIY